MSHELGVSDARYKHKTRTLEAGEFLRRFVQHVLPKSFVKIRHYGLLANRHREARLAVCRRLLLVVNVAATLPDAQEAPIEPAQPPSCANTWAHWTTPSPFSTESGPPAFAS